MLAVEHIGDAAFARLGIDADDRLVRAADVLWVDGEIGHAPRDVGILGNFACTAVEAFFDRILMRAGERGEDQLASVGLTLRHWQARDPLIDGADRRKVREIQPGGDAVAVHVESDRDDIEVAGAFAIAKQRAFDAVGAGHQAKLGGSDASAAVIVRVQRDDHRIAARQVATHPFDHVGMDVGSRPLDGVRQVDDHFFLRCRLPDVDHARAAFECEVEFGVGERFGRVLQDHLGVRNGRDEFFHEARAFERDVVDRFAGSIAKSDAALQWRGRVVNVHDRALGSIDRIEGLTDQVVAGLHQHLDGDIVGNAVFIDEAAQEIEFRIGGGRKADLDLFEAHTDEQVEELEFFINRHRLRQSLVAIAKVDRAPLRGTIDHLVRPGAVGQVDRRKGPVFFERGGLHGNRVMGKIRLEKRTGKSPRGWAGRRRNVKQEKVNGRPTLEAGGAGDCRWGGGSRPKATSGRRWVKPEK